MLVTTNEINQAWRADGRKMQIKVMIGGVTYDNDTVTSLSFDSGSISGESFQLGSTYMNSLEIVFPSILETIREDIEVQAELGILVNGIYEYAKLGKFIISEFNRDRNSNTTTITAVDQMILMEGMYESKLSYPATIRDVALEIANLSGVVINPVSFSTLPTSTIKKLEGYTCRQAIGIIAQFEGGFANFNRLGQLQIRRLAPNDFSISASDYLLKGFKKNEKTYRINGIRVRTGEEDSDVLTVGTSVGNVVELENKAMTQQLLNAIWSKVEGISYFPFELKWRGNPNLEAGDWINILDRDGNRYSVPNLSYSFVFNGGLTAESKATTVGNSEVTYSYKGPLKQQIIQIQKVLEGANGWNSNYYDETEPQHPKEGDLWFKPNGQYKEIWTYENVNGILKWVLQISDAPDEAIKQAIDQADKDIAQNIIDIDKSLSKAEQAELDAGFATDLAKDASALANQTAASLVNVKAAADQAKADASTSLTNAQNALNKAIKSSVIHYALSANGTTPPATGWQTSNPNPTADQYVWTRTTITLNDNSPIVSYSVGKIGSKGDKGDIGLKGDTGLPGVNAPKIISVKEQYYLSTSNASPTGGSWVDTVPTWSSGKYYWLRVSTTFDNATTTLSTPVLDAALNQSLVKTLEVQTATQNLSATVTQHATLIESKASATTVDTLTGRVSTTEGQITTQAGQIALKANTSDVNTLTGRVTTAEGRITTNAQQIDLRATKTDVNTLTGRVSTAEGNITTQAGQIALKANQSVVDTLTGRMTATEASIKITDGKVTTLTTKTDGNTTQIGLLETSYSGLNSTVTQVKNNLEGMEIGGRNLLIRTAEINNTWINTTGTVAPTLNHATSDFVQISPNKEYFFTKKNSELVTNDNQNGVTGFWRFAWYDENKTYINRQPDTTNSFLWRAPNNACFLRVSYPVDSYPKLERGNKATDWSPAPEDYTTVTAFSALEQNLNGFKTTVANTYADKTTVNQLAGQWQTTTTLANGNASQISSLGTQINLRATKTEVAESILADKTIKDTRTTNQLPPWYYTNYPKQKAYEFKTCATIGLPTSAGTYASVVTEVPWTDASGGTIEQTATATDGVYQRRGTTTWSAWAKIADSSNIVSQINISPESILIASAKIQIKGDTYIDNGVIKTAHIADLAVSGAKIANASIASAKIISLDAAKISVGTLTGHTLNGAVINGGSITGTTFHNEGTDGNVTIANGRIRAKDFFVRENGALVSETGYIVVRSMLSDVFLQSNNEVRVTSVRSYDEFMPIRASDFIATNKIYNYGNYESATVAMLQANNGYAILRSLNNVVFLQGQDVRCTTTSNTSSYVNLYANAFIGRGGNTAFGTDTGYSVLRSSGDTQPVYIQGSEIRATKVSNAGTYVAVRASAFPTGSMEEFKTDIKKYTKSALHIIRESTIYDYKLRSELESGRVKTRIGLVIGHGYNTPNEIIDGDGVEQYAMNSLGWKAIQELDVSIQNANKRINTTDSKLIKLVANDSIYGLRLNNLESEVFRLKKRIEELEKTA